MESKKINQLATEMSPAASDLTIIGDPITGVSKKITLEQISSLFSSSISFYSNYASFPATGSIDTLYCAKDTNKLYLWNGSAYVQTFPSQALLDTYQLRSEKGAVNGYASLDGSGKVPSTELPSYVDDIVEVANYASLPVTGETGKIYITLDNNKIYRWSGSVYVEIASNNAIWGSITGTLSNQTDLQNALNAKVPTTRTLTIDGTTYDLSANRTWNILPTGGADGQILAKASATNYDTEWIDNYTSTVKHYVKLSENMTIGTAAYIDDANGTNMIAAKASYDTEATSSQTMGLIGQTGVTNDIVFLITEGLLAGLNTSSATIGDPVYLGSNGALIFGVANKPSAPNNLVYLGVVTRVSSTVGEIFVKVQNGYELQELHNVAISSVANNQGLFYESSTSLWKNKSIATVLGYTPANDASVVHLAGSETITGNKYYTARQYFEDYPIYSESGISLDNRLSGTNSSNSTTLCGDVNGLQINLDGGGYNHLAFASTTVGNTYTFPNATGTIALTSDLSSYVPTSRTLTINGTTYDLSANRSWTITAGVSSVTATSPLFSSGGATPDITIQVANTSQSGYLSSTDWNTFNGKQAQINGTGFVKASGTTISYDNSTYLTTSAASSTYLPLAGGTLTGALIVNNNLTVNNGTYSLISLTGSSFGQIYASGNLLLDANTGGYISLRPNGSIEALRLASTGAATFSSSVTANGTVAIKGSNALYLYNTDNTTISAILNGGASGVGDMSFYTGGSQKMILNSSGNVGIGTTSPSAALNVVTTAAVTAIFTRDLATDATLRILGDSDGSIIDTQGIHNLRFFTNDTERMRITSGGNVLIGTTTDSGHKIRAVGNSFYLGNDNGSSATPSYIDLGQNYSNGSTRDKLKIYLFNDGANEKYGFTVASEGDIQYHSNAFHKFFINNAEKMRVASNGDVCINTTTSGGYKLNVNGSASFGSVYVGSLGTGTVYSSSGSLTNTNPSDRRLKENINSISYGLNEILQLNPVSFDWKNDNNKNKQFGFIAQEVKEIMPEAIIEGEYLGLEKDAIYTALVNAIKELEARLKTLENK